MMELAMTNGFGEVGFAEMNENEMIEIDGGIDGWGIASAILSIAGGGFAIAAAVADPEPVSKSYAIKSGVCWIASGVTGFIGAVTE